MRILVIRFSAMGDVALVAPVLQSVLSANEHVEITMLSRPSFSAFFAGMDRLHFYSADVDRDYNGVNGLYKLYQEIGVGKFDVVVDLHDNLRSRGLCTFFRLSGVRIVRFDKGRKEKKKLVKQGAGAEPLIHTTERYLRAFEQLDIPVLRPLKPLSISPSSDRIVDDLLKNVGRNARLIGIAPFARHQEKTWPINLMIEFMRLVWTHHPNTYFFLFGGGKQEIIELEKINVLFPTSRVVAGLLELREELVLISRLDVMISMDSANMHMAALTGTKVISLWGPTHPHAGFGPLFNEDLMIQSSNPGRPYSIYGKTKHKKQFDQSIKSMESIAPSLVFQAVESLFFAKI